MLSIELSPEFAAESVNEKETHTNIEREREKCVCVTYKTESGAI